MRNPQFDVGLDHLGQGCVSVLRSQVRKSAATLSRSCAYLRTLLVTRAVGAGPVIGGAETVPRRRADCGVICRAVGATGTSRRPKAPRTGLTSHSVTVLVGGGWLVELAGVIRGCFLGRFPPVWGRNRTRRKRFRGILGNARRFGASAISYRSVENSNLSAPGLDSVVAPHLCHRAVADHQVLANGRELQCVTPHLFGGGAERDRNQGCCDPGCVADRGSGSRRTILGCRRHNQRRRTRWVGTSPTRRPSNEERQVGRVGARVRGGRRPDHSTNYLLGRGGSCLAVCAMLR